MSERDRIEEVLRNRILFIGGEADELPSLRNHAGVQIYSGCPNDLINELLDAGCAAQAQKAPELEAEAGCDSAQESAKENDARYYWRVDSLKWGCPENVQHLILQLQTLDPEMKVSSVHHIHMPSGETRARAYGLSMSRERWNETGWLDYSLPVPECLAIWAQPPQELEGVNGPKTQESAPEEWMRQAFEEVMNRLGLCEQMAPFDGRDEALSPEEIADCVEIIRKHAKKGK